LLTEFSRHCVDCEQNMDSKEQAKAKTALRTHVESLEKRLDEIRKASFNALAGVDGGVERVKELFIEYQAGIAKEPTP